MIDAFHYAHMVLSQVAQGIVHRIAFAKFSPYLAVLVYDYRKSVNHALSRSFRDGVCPFRLRQAFARLSGAGF